MTFPKARDVVVGTKDGDVRQSIFHVRLQDGFVLPMEAPDAKTYSLVEFKNLERCKYSIWD